jgi:hypothetical protein
MYHVGLIGTLRPLAEHVLVGLGTESRSLGDFMKQQIVGAVNWTNRLFEACGSYQWAREFLKNSLEANATRVEFGIEWQAVAKFGVYGRGREGVPGDLRRGGSLQDRTLAEAGQERSIGKARQSLPERGSNYALIDGIDGRGITDHAAPVDANR